MPSERHTRPPPRERTFAEVFPWRNMRRALVLLLLIVGIVMIKRSTGPLLARIGGMWGAATPGAARVAGAPVGVTGGDSLHRIRVQPHVPVSGPATDARAR